VKEEPKKPARTSYKYRPTEVIETKMIMGLEGTSSGAIVMGTNSAAWNKRLSMRKSKADKQ